MYEFLLIFHSYLRWLILGVFLITLIRAYSGLASKKDWTASDEQWGKRLAMLVSIQFVIGVILLFVSPSITAALANGMGDVMKDSNARMLVIEHPLTMLIGLALVHIGKSRSGKAKDALAKHKAAAVFYTIALVLILSRIPWEKATLLRGA